MGETGIWVLGILGLAVVIGTVAIFALAVLKGQTATAEYGRKGAKIKVK